MIFVINKLLIVDMYFFALVNNIFEISDFDSSALSRLTTLELRNNQLISTQGIGMLPNLQKLYLVSEVLTVPVIT